MENNIYIRALRGEGRDKTTLHVPIPVDIKKHLAWKNGDLVEVKTVNDILMIRKVEKQ